MAMLCNRQVSSPRPRNMRGLPGVLRMMPRYFFDIADGDNSGHDDEGLNFSDLKAARAGALRALGEIARDELPDGDRRDFRVSIRDEAGQILLEATLALRVSSTPPEQVE